MIGHGGRGARHIDAGLQLLRLPEVPLTRLQRPRAVRIPRNAARVRVEPRLLDVPPVFIRLSAAKRRALELDGLPYDTKRSDSECDVRRVQPVMADRSLGVVGSGEAMHERRRAERGLSRKAEVREHRALAGKPQAIGHGQLHEEVVRVLAIDKRLAIQRLSRLEEQRVAALADGRRIGREHAAQPEGAGSQRALGHEHEHRRTEELAVAPWAALIVVDHVGEAMEHEHPVFLHEMHPFHGRRVRLPAGARGLALHRVGAVHSLHCALALCAGRVLRGIHDRDHRAGNEFGIRLGERRRVLRLRCYDGGCRVLLGR